MSGTDTSTNLAAAAPAIALVALLTTIGQLLQQYLATADGYRRCQKSVMGEYAHQTRLQWRWREFRFETLYTTPEIFMSGDGSPCRIGQVVLTGSESARARSLVPAAPTVIQEEVTNVEPWSRGEGPVQTLFVHEGDVSRLPNSKRLLNIKQDTTYRGELSCWLPFLHWLHETSQASLSHEVPMRADPIDYPHSRMGLPTIIFREISWDFQPPDVIRPLAKTTLSDISIMARRMGMRWKDFRPSDGILRAEGHSHTITSTVVRSLGIVLQYSYTGQRRRLLRVGLDFERSIATGPLTGGYARKTLVIGSLYTEQEEIYIPRARSDRLGSGVVRTDPLLGLPGLFVVSTQPEIVTSLSLLDQSGHSSATLSNILKENPEFRLRVADLVALSVQPVRYRGSRLVQIPAPSDNVRGATTSSIGRSAFRQCLEKYIESHCENVGVPTRQALEICSNIRESYATWDQTDGYSVQSEQWIVTGDPHYLDKLLNHITSLTDLLHYWEQHHSFRYINLLGIHIRVAMFAEGGETSMLRSWGTDYTADVNGYFSLLPKIIEEMKKTGFHDDHMIVDAWVTMMLRAMCWGACHFFVPGERECQLSFMAVSCQFTLAETSIPILWPDRRILKGILRFATARH